MKLYKDTLVIFTTSTDNIQIGKIVSASSRHRNYYSISGIRSSYVLHFNHIDKITKLELTVEEEEELLTKSK